MFPAGLVSVLLALFFSCAKESVQTGDSVDGTTACEVSAEPQPEAGTDASQGKEPRRDEEMKRADTMAEDTSDGRDYVWHNISATSTMDDDESASGEGETRTTLLPTGHVIWSAGDRIRVCYYSSEEGKYISKEVGVSSISADGRNATFSLGIPETGKPVYALHPSSDAILNPVYIDPSTGQLFLQLLDNGVSGSFEDAHLAAARLVGDKFVFRAIGGVVAFKTTFKVIIW